jgi:hypothetical protein
MRKSLETLRICPLRSVANASVGVMGRAIRPLPRMIFEPMRGGAQAGGLQKN